MKRCFCFILLSGCLLSNPLLALENPQLLIKFQKDIFTEMIRTHGHQLESESVLKWCGYDELAEELSLTTNGLKRAVFQSFVVAGTQNVQATEIARQLPDEEWAIFNNALMSDIKRYQEGLSKGLSLSFKTAKSKKRFCNEAEQLAFKSARTLINK